MTECVIPGFDLALTADSGQCFRLIKTGEDRFRLIAGGRLLYIDAPGDDRYLFRCEEDDFILLWRDYFDLKRDYGAILSSVPEGDAFLSASIRHAGGLRILHQEPWETLVCFIISQRKNMPAIRQCVEKLSANFGEPVAEGCFSFPGPQRLARLDVSGLNACGLGYRSPYILNTARIVAEGKLDLDGLRALDDEALLAALCGLPGVGPKVAQCVMLFAYRRLDAFPRDVWINRVLESQYAQGFPFERFHGYAGIIQQYMFCFARSPEYKKMQEYRENTVISSNEA